MLCTTAMHDSNARHKWSITGEIKKNIDSFQWLNGLRLIDSTDRERLAVTREELYRMLAHEELSKAAVLIYANKQDLKGSMTAAEISKQLDLTSIKKHQWQIQSCCALTGEGLYQGLEWICSQLKKK
ncbi:unnamed protein product [Timema podura]|uniref:ADP-ribosylation factor n=1 Tax=Timema podura TaxID=61482 RepID=A0ABN7NWQ2_TIMPD|nr:unnamed protein product [Timema podura]